MSDDGPTYFDASRALLTEESLENTLRLLNENFNLLGFPSVFTVSESTLHLDVASLVNGSHEMTTLYQQSLQYRENLELKLKRAEADIEHLQRVQRRLQSNVDEAEKTIGQSREQERQLTNKVKAMTSSHKANRDEMRRLKSDIAHVQAQFKHERNRLEREASALRERLHSSMTTQRNAPHMDMLNSLHHLDGKRRTWARPKGGGLLGEKSKDELHLLTLRQMEAKQEETLIENKDLRRCLFRMQRKLDALAQTNDDLVGSLSDFDEEEPELGDPLESGMWLDEGAEEAREVGLFHLPFDLMRDDLERNFRERMRQLRTRIAQNAAASAASAPKESPRSPARPASSGAESLRSTWEEVEQLKKQVAQYERVIDSQEALIKRSLLDTLRRPSREAVPEFSRNRELLEEHHRLAEERRAFYEEKAHFDKERHNFSEAKKNLDEDRASFLRQQLALLTPTSRGRLLPNPGQRRNSIAATTLTPSRSSFTPAPTVSRAEFEQLRFPSGSGSSQPSSSAEPSPMSP